MNKKGGSLIELIVIFALALILLPALLISLTASREGKAQQVKRRKAVEMVKGYSEIVKSLKDTNFSHVVTNGTFHPQQLNNSWVLSEGTYTVDGYTISISISDVYRDVNWSIVTSGGTLDPSTKKAEILVSWVTPDPASVSNTLFITRHRSNMSQIDTTTSDFSSGSASGIIVADSFGSGIPNDAELTLGAGGSGNWCDPNLSIASLDLPKNGVANAISAIEGRVVAGTGENASGVSFASIGVNNSSPPTSFIEGTFDGYKTNGVYVDGNYAYLATDNNSKEMVIIDLTQTDPSTGKYIEVGYFNTPSSTNDGLSVAVSGNIGFLTAGSRLYTINLSSKIGSRSQLAYRSLASTGTKVVINGSYAFVSIAGASQEMQIVQFNSSGTSLTITGYADVNGAAAYDVSVNETGTRAYLATGVSSTQSEFFIIDTSSKSGSRPTVGSYNANGMDPNAVNVVTGNKAILVGTGAEEYQVIDISNETSPVRCGGLQINTGINGIASVLELDNDAYSYIITGDSSTELKIIGGGPGGEYVASGIFTSNYIQFASPSAMNGFVAHISQPNQTVVRMQIASADTDQGNCANVTYTFIGPDYGNQLTSYFTPTGDVIRGAFPLSGPNTFKNPGQCVKYRIWMDTNDSTSSPVVRDFSINYSQ